MDKLNFIRILTDYYNGRSKRLDVYNLIYEYCIDKGKDNKLSELYVNFITTFDISLISNVMNTIIRDWGIKYEIIEIHEVLPDGRTKIVKIY